MSKARAPRWLKRKAKRCKKDVERRCFDWNLVCSHGDGGGAQRHNDCNTLSNDTFPDSYLSIGLVTKANKNRPPHFVKQCNKPVLCVGKARAPRWLKRKANRCKKDVERRCFDWNHVCSHGGGGGAQRHNDCDTLSNDTFPDSYLPIGLVTEGNKSHHPHFVKHCNISVLCMGKAIAPRWLKCKLNRCKKGNPRESWIPDSPLWIPDSGFRIPDSMSVDSGFHAVDSGFHVSGFRIPWIPLAGFRIPQTKTTWISDSGLPYMGRLPNFRQKRS
ncbi:uncharacterized protein [Montipora foliosa]|uniref:uncharacterized protein n=1 Tax=Montipora foliosa TaxID=591990 RepID=UPI0035F1AC1E